MMAATIYHNPDCGTSRNALALLRHAGRPDRDRIPPHAAVSPRPSEIWRKRHGLQRARSPPPERHAVRRARSRHDLALTDDQLLDAIEWIRSCSIAPLSSPTKAWRCAVRPELVLDLLPYAPEGDLHKDDGSIPSSKTNPLTDFAALRAALEADNLPADDVAEEGNRRFFRFTTLDGESVGYRRFETYGKDALIRSS